MFLFMSKKRLFLILSGVLVFTGYPLGHPVLAGSLGNYGPNISLVNLIPNILATAWIIFAGLAVICFIIAGVLFLTAQGDPEKVASARSAFIWGVVGVVVGIVAYSIIAIVSTALRG